MSEQTQANAGTVKRTMSMERANLLAAGLVLPVILIVLVPYGLIWGWGSLFAGISALSGSILQIALFMLAIAAAIVIHEGLHGIGWGILGGAGWQNISFGVKSMTPYCHCSIPISASAYRLGGALPGLVLGVIPYIAALILQSGWLLLFSLIMLIGALGDVMVLWLLRDVPSTAKVQDHPSEVGCQILTEG